MREDTECTDSPSQILSTNDMTVSVADEALREKPQEESASMMMSSIRHDLRQ